MDYWYNVWLVFRFLFFVFCLFCVALMYIVNCFFFQAEDGIRDYKVTGVQTCALPISRDASEAPRARPAQPPGWQRCARTRERRSRSEERRVGKECRSRWSPYH